MRRVEPAILRFTADLPDSAELRYYLRHACVLLVESDEASLRASAMRRARAWVAAALCGIDQHLRALEPAVPNAIADRVTDTHLAPDELLIPTLARSERK